MLQTDALESAILRELTRVGTCSLDELSERLPSHSLNEMFVAVDQLRRDDTVTLKHLPPFRYLLSLESRRSDEVRHDQSASAQRTR